MKGCIKMVNKHLHHLAIKMLIQYNPSELFYANSVGVWQTFSFFRRRLNESASRMAGAIKTRWILLHMKREGGEEVVVNPLALLCLTDSIVLCCFQAAEDSPPRCDSAGVEVMKSKSLGRTEIQWESRQDSEEMAGEGGFCFCAWAGGLGCVCVLVCRRLKRETVWGWI